MTGISENFEGYIFSFNLPSFYTPNTKSTSQIWIQISNVY